MLEIVESGFEQRHVAAELVDEERRDACAMRRFEQLDRADELREDAAAIDIADEHDRRLGALGHLHVHDIARLQVDLGGRAGAFDDDEVVTLRAGAASAVARSTSRSSGLRRWYSAKCIRATETARAPPPAIAVPLSGLSRIGFMSTCGRDARGLGLHGLRAADLAAVGRDERS